MQHRDLGIDWQGRAFVDEEGRFRGEITITPLDKVKSRPHQFPRKFTVVYKVYGLPLGHENHPIINSSVGSLPLPKKQVTVPLHYDAYFRSARPAKKLAEGKYVMEITVFSEAEYPAPKAVFFDVEGEWFCSFGKVCL